LGPKICTERIWLNLLDTAVKFTSCKDAAENPILETTCGALGPGHNTLIEDAAGQTWIVYHAWDAAYSRRRLWIDRLDWKDGKPVVDGPTCTAQDAPTP